MNGEVRRQESREERILRIIQAKQRLAAQRGFWIVNAYTDIAKAYYRVVKQVDEALHRNRDLIFMVAGEMEKLTEKLLELNEIAQVICRKLSERYEESRFIEKLKRIKEIKGDGGNEKGND